MSRWLFGIVFGASAWAAVGAQASPREAHAALPGVRLWYTDTGGVQDEDYLELGRRLRPAPADLYAPPPVLRLYWEQPDIFNRSVLAFVRRPSR